MISKIEKWVFKILTALLMAYIAIELLELVSMFIRAAINHDDNEPGRLFFSKAQLNEIVPVFFNVLIAIEMIDTFNLHLNEKSIKVTNILLIALMAVGRKLLAYDFSHVDGLSNLGLAALIIAISAGYYLIKKVEK
jgi:uncharacterized membrane protein (DUF373 family)